VGIFEESVEIWLNKVCNITPSLSLSSVEKLSRFLVYSEDVLAAFHLHFVNYPQVPICCLLECIFSIWQGIHSSHAFVMSPEFFLPPILPGPVSRLVVREWLSGHRWWIWSTELTCLCERLGTVLSSEVVTNFIRSYLHQFFDDSHGLKASLKPLRRPFDRCQSRLEAINNGWDIKQINW